MSYLAFDIKVVQEKADTEDPDEAEEGSENGEIPDVKPVIGDAVDEDTNLPKVRKLDDAAPSDVLTFQLFLPVAVPGVLGEAAVGLRVQVPLRGEPQLPAQLLEGVRRLEAGRGEGREGCRVCRLGYRHRQHRFASRQARAEGFEEGEEAAQAARSRQAEDRASPPHPGEERHHCRGQPGGDGRLRPQDHHHAGTVAGAEARQQAQVEARHHRGHSG